MQTYLIVLITFIVTAVVSYLLFRSNSNVLFRSNVLGLKWNSSNRGVIDTMNATQDVIKNLQQYVCSAPVKQMLLSQINNLPISPDENISATDAKAMVSSMIPTMYEGIDITPIRSSLITLSNTIIDNSSVNGKADLPAAKAYLTNILIAFCGN